MFYINLFPTLRLHAIGEEHRNNEKAHKILMATRDSILKEIVDIQMDLRNLQKRSLLLVCESIEKVGICEYVTRFSQEFQSIMQSIQALTANIKHPQPIRSLYVPGKRQIVSPPFENLFLYIYRL